MKRLLATTATLSLLAGGAYADAFTDQLVAKFQDMGFTFIEVQDGISQVKIEGVKGNTQLEVIYDRATGRILKQEQERAEAEDIGRTGVRIRQRDRDFVRVSTAPSPDSLVDTDAIVSDLRADGYNFIEIKRGPTQTKIEAIRGNEELEIVYDNATGDVLKREVGRADADEIGRTGIEIDTEDRDFVGDRRRGDDDHDDDDDRSGSNSGSGSHDDDDDDDHDNSGPGSSSSGSGSSGSDDDDDDDDNSGSGSSSSGSGSSGSSDDDDK